MEWLAIPLGIFAFFIGLALLMNGFPDIKITKNYYNNKKDD